MYKYRVAVNNQLCYKYSSSDRLVSDGINFTDIVFMFYSGWDGLDCVAQFRQGEECYSVALVNNECKLPNELVAGNVSISVFGYKAGEAVRGTTVSLNDQIYDSGFDGNADPVPPTPDLYSQLLAQIKRTEADTSGYAESAKQSAGEAKGSQKAAANSAEEAEASANKSAESAKEAERAKNEAAAEMGKVQDAGEAAVSEISRAKIKATQDVQQAGAEAVDAVDQARTQALSDMQGLGNTLVSSIDEAGRDALDRIEAGKDQSLQDIEVSKTSALEEVNRAGTTQVGAVNTAGQVQQTTIQKAGETATQQVQQTGVEQVNKVTQAGDDKLAEIKAANAILPTPTEADAGKAPIAQPDGTYALEEVTVDAYTKEESDARYAPIEAAIRPTVSGNPATLEHSVAWAMQGLNVYGKSTQVTTTGAQLFDISKASPAGSTYGMQIEISGEYVELTGTITAGSAGMHTFRLLNIGQQEIPGASQWKATDVSGTSLGVIDLILSSDEVLIRCMVPPDGTRVSNRFRIMASEDGVSTWEPYTGGKPSPSPDYPQEIVTAGLDGSIDITVSDGADQSQQLSIQTPNGLPGILVNSGGTYTDETGQKWVCDEVDFVRGVYVQKIGKVVIDGTKLYFSTTPGSNFWNLPNNSALYGTESIRSTITTHFPSNLFFINDRNNFMYTIRNLMSGYFDTVEGLNQFCVEENSKGNPLTVYYIYKDPQETPLSAEELAAYAALRTYDGTTVVATDAPVAGLSARYVADGAAYIESKIQAAVTEAVTQAVALTGGNA